MATAPKGLFATIRDYLHPSSLMERYNLTQDKLLCSILAAGIGFLTGYLLKRYHRFVFVVVLCVVGLIIAQRFGLVVVSVHWNTVQQMLCITPLEPLEGSIVAAYWHWVKMHLSIVISGGIGFLFGLRMA